MLSAHQHAQELTELRLGIEQVTERELDMAKRLEDFIIQSQDQNAMLLAEVTDLKNLLAVKEQQLASATFRYNKSTVQNSSEWGTDFILSLNK